ncbi:hypothetical protein SKAU_G00347990 [Synaphobranchus kaupii]|uniref:Uncharacterized protein n=1 Tax=Synaphobranchus kaupii TaxID=118154 RepID=A0A9Q1EJU7_SYNKA|nr:hypothetical protein SKAU_G00347990 [Synaphobranchus kaupii]
MEAGGRWRQRRLPSGGGGEREARYPSMHAHVCRALKPGRRGLRFRGRNHVRTTFLPSRVAFRASSSISVRQIESCICERSRKTRKGK